MGLTTVQEIERAIDTLTAQELEELWAWLDQYPHPIDTRIRSDLAAGRLDKAIERALEDEKERASPAALALDATLRQYRFLAGVRRPSAGHSHPRG